MIDLVSWDHVRIHLLGTKEALNMFQQSGIVEELTGPAIDSLRLKVTSISSHLCDLGHII